jgi:hypothetical protein
VRDAIERATMPKGSRLQSLEEHRENWLYVILLIECGLDHGSPRARKVTDEELASWPPVPGRITLENILGATRRPPMSDEEFVRHCFSPEMRQRMHSTQE